jgi:hypothetical protein
MEIEQKGVAGVIGTVLVGLIWAVLHSGPSDDHPTVYAAPGEIAPAIVVETVPPPPAPPESVTIVVECGCHR